MNWATDLEENGSIWRSDALEGVVENFLSLFRQNLGHLDVDDAENGPVVRLLQLGSAIPEELACSQTWTKIFSKNNPAAEFRSVSSYNTTPDGDKHK